MNVEIVELPCKHLQGDGSKTYYALKIDGIVYKCSESAYEGNDVMFNTLAKITYLLMEGER